MKKVILTTVAAIAIVFSYTACKKKETGVCYCSYMSGDKKEFDLRAYNRSTQIDSCHIYDQNASAFAGSCKLK